MTVLKHVIESISPASAAHAEGARQRVASACLPLLERLAAQLGGAQHTAKVRSARRTIVVVAGDHGAGSPGIALGAAHPTVTAARAIADGTAALAQVARASNTPFVLVDAGAAEPAAMPPSAVQLGRGPTRDLLREPAMTIVDASIALEHGIALAISLSESGLDLLAIGALGLGAELSTAALLGAAIGGATGGATEAERAAASGIGSPDDAKRAATGTADDDAKHAVMHTGSGDDARRATMSSASDDAKPAAMDAAGDDAKRAAMSPAGADAKRAAIDAAGDDAKRAAMSPAGADAKRAAMGTGSGDDAKRAAMGIDPSDADAVAAWHAGARLADAGPLELLATFGGGETAVLAGLILGAASTNVPVVLDSYATGAAALVAAMLAPNVRGYLVAAHAGALGHKRILAHLGLVPVFDVGLGHGEGTGAAMVIPLVDQVAALAARD